MGCFLCKESSPYNCNYTSRRPTINNDGLVTKKRVSRSHPLTNVPDPIWRPAPSFMATPLEWPSWLVEVAGEALVGWAPRKIDSFHKLSKIGQGTYSNVYKAKDMITGKIVALKKVRFDNHEVESIRFMAREITVLRRLDHPNVIKLEGIITSRVSCSLYLIFEYMEHDLAGLAASPVVDFTLPQIKCYMKQLFSGLEYCHSRGVLHRDIKCSNLLIDNQGILKIADFGLASSYDPEQKQPMTSRVVTLWYRPPELILGATHYGPSVDLWSAGCILAELLAKQPILPGRTEVEQLHRIFKLCGSPSENYWKTAKFSNADMFKSDKPYKNNITETFRDFPSSLPVLQTLLSIDPSHRGSATDALISEFFTSEPLASEPASLPHYLPSKEIDVKHKEEQSQRKNAVSRRGHNFDDKKMYYGHIRTNRATQYPQVGSSEIQMNLNKLKLMGRANTTSKSEKFPPPHQDGSLGFTLDKTSINGPVSLVMPDTTSFASSVFEADKEIKSRRTGNRIAPSHMIIRSYKPLSVGNLQKKSKNNSNLHRRERWRGKEFNVFGFDSSEK